MNRRQFLLAGTIALQAHAATGQPFHTGIVPAGRADRFWPNCDEASALGFHFIEINNTRAEIAETYSSRIGEFRDEMARRKLTLAGMALFSHMADAGQRAQLIEHHMRLGRFLAAVGGKYITHMIAPGAILNEPSDESEYRAVDMKIWAAQANEIGRRLMEEHGVRLAYHPEQGEIRSGLSERILDATDERYFRLLIDTGHIASGGGDPAALCRRYMTRLECVHLKDFKPGAQPSRAGNAPFGEGAVDLPAVIRVLLRSNFTGWVMSESGGTNQGMRDYMTGPLQLAI